MSKTKQIAICSMMIALALSLSYMERFIPLQMVIPLPGVKLGLANIVTLIALYLLKTKHAFFILIPRCILGAVFGGGITGLLFSLCGGVLAMGVMAGARPPCSLGRQAMVPPVASRRIFFITGPPSFLLFWF